MATAKTKGKAFDVFQHVYEGMVDHSSLVRLDEYTGDNNPQHDKSYRYVATVLTPSDAGQDVGCVTQIFRDVVGKMDNANFISKQGKVQLHLNFGFAYVYTSKPQPLGHVISISDIKFPAILTAFYPQGILSAFDDDDGFQLMHREQFYTLDFKEKCPKLTLHEDFSFHSLGGMSWDWLKLTVKRKTGHDFRFLLWSEKLVDKTAALSGGGVNAELAQQASTLLCRNGAKLEITPNDKFHIEFVRHKVDTVYTKFFPQFASLGQVTFHHRFLTEYSRPEGRSFSHVIPCRQEVSIRLDWARVSALGPDTFAPLLYRFAHHMANTYHN